jgi:HAD superfamily hydrolase (TIGR01509 family)
MESIGAVLFDLDGVLVDSEQVWDTARRELTTARGGRWRQEATRAMMGMSSTEWSAYMHDELSVPLDPPDISREVVERMQTVYRERLPLIPGAKAAVARMAERWRLGLASSSNRQLIDLVLELAGMREWFAATVSSEEVARGKPAPDVYLEVARRVAVPADRCVAIEDSTNGIRAAKAARMGVIAIPNRALPPEPDALSVADRVLASLDRLTAEEVEGLADRA